MAVIPKRRRRKDPQGTMTLMEHLGELRTRLVVAVIALAVGIGIAWPLYGHVFKFFTGPYCDFIVKHPTLSPNPGEPCRLAWTSVVEPFVTKLKVVTFIGFGIALPVILYEFWMFITPGLTSRERRYAMPFVFASLALFGLGAWFGILTLPKGLNFLLGFAGTNRVLFILSVGKYLSFVILVVLAFGLSFEFPLVLI